MLLVKTLHPFGFIIDKQVKKAAILKKVHFVLNLPNFVAETLDKACGAKYIWMFF